MAYTLPVFNLTCRITHGGGAFFDTICNLAFSRRSRYEILKTDLAAAPPLNVHIMYVLLPALTDIRGALEAGGNRDHIEIVIGSARHYEVLWVDDSGKGFPNEHRIAIVVQLLAFPIPIP